MLISDKRQGLLMLEESIPLDSNKDALDNRYLPLLYHLHHVDYLEDIPFWLSLAQEQGSPILELGCGTGRVLLQLAGVGLKCIGIDKNWHMLEFLKNQISNASTRRVEIINADFTSFCMRVRLPLIIMPCNTYSTLNPEDRLLLLECVWENLDEGGIFSVSMPNPEVLKSQNSIDDLEIEKIISHPTLKNPVQVSYRILKEKFHITFHWYYDQLLPDGHVSRLSVNTTHFLVSMNQYIQELQNSGFEIEKIYGDFIPTPHLPDSTNLIIIARKI